MGEYAAIPDWQGQTVVVVGSGRSLTSEQVHRLALASLDDRCRVIAINDAIYLCWWADWLHACDFKWWNWHIQRVQHFKGGKSTLDKNVPLQWALRLKNTGKEGFDENPTACRTGNNGGYQGIHIALHAVKEGGRVLLSALDMKGNHFFGEHPDRVKVDHKQVMVPLFETIRPAAQARGVDIVNCTPDSAIDCFARGRLEDFL